MKLTSSLILSCLSFFCFEKCLGQDLKEEKLLRPVLSLGLKYTPFDYVGGFTTGLLLKKDKVSFGIRADISIPTSKDSTVYYGVITYRLYGYLEGYYDFYRNSSISIGYGWVSNKNKVVPLAKKYGYSVFTFGIHQEIFKNRVRLELRGDIPALRERFSVTDMNRAFPISLSVSYLFKKR